MNHPASDWLVLIRPVTPNHLELVLIQEMFEEVLANKQEFLVIVIVYVVLEVPGQHKSFVKAPINEKSAAGFPD